MIAGAVLAAPAQSAPGDLDPSFGVGGKVTTNFGFVGDRPLLDSARAVAVQPDGKIVAAGDSGNGSDFSDFALARYNEDGSLDTTFASDGTVTTRVAEQWDQAYALALQFDGKIVTAGWAGPENIPFTDFALARYNADGSLDATFGGDGKVTSDLDEEVFFFGHDGAFAVAIQPDGKIVAAGLADLFNPAVGILARYNADGSLDAGFGTGGKIVAPFATTSVVVQADGQIVAAGATSGDFALARYKADGSLDATFGGSGTVTTDFGGGEDGASEVVIQTDGKIVLAGSASGDVALARYNADGSLDTAFGSGGKVTTDFGGPDGASGVAIQTNGKLVVAGSIGSQFGLARYNTDGSLDSTFASSGMVTTQFGGSDRAAGLAIQADGKIVAAGSTFANFNSDFALARYLGDPPVTPVTQVSIDVQPRNKKNRVRLSKGVIPVAILTTDTFDATTVDPATVCFGDAETPAERDCTAARRRIKDANRDGRPDLLLRYEVLETGIDAGDSSACLTGRTFAGLSIEGCDSIRTFPVTHARGVSITFEP